MITVRVAVDGRALTAAMLGLEVALADLRPVWPAVKEIFLTMEKAHFDSLGTYAPGTRWVPLSPRYAAWKARHYPGQPILRRTDELYASLTERGANVLNAIDNRGPEWAEFGTRVPYAVYHHSPLPRRSNLPRRIVIPEPTKAEGERMVDAIIAHCFKVMREHVEDLA